MLTLNTYTHLFPDVKRTAGTRLEAQLAAAREEAAAQEATR